MCPPIWSCNVHLCKMQVWYPGQELWTAGIQGGICVVTNSGWKWSRLDMMSEKMRGHRGAISWDWNPGTKKKAEEEMSARSLQRPHRVGLPCSQLSGMLSLFPYWLFYLNTGPCVIFSRHFNSWGPWKVKRHNVSACLLSLSIPKLCKEPRGPKSCALPLNKGLLWVKRNKPLIPATAWIYFHAWKYFNH